MVYGRLMPFSPEPILDPMLSSIPLRLKKVRPTWSLHHPGWINLSLSSQTSSRLRFLDRYPFGSGYLGAIGSFHSYALFSDGDLVFLSAIQVCRTVP